MDRRTVVAVGMAFLAGAVVTAALVAPQRAFATQAGKAPPQTYVYYPASGANPDQLLDTRTGATYKRSSTSTQWEPNVKALARSRSARRPTVTF